MDETAPLPAGDRQAWDAELVRRIRAGDERALEAVFRAHYAGMALQASGDRTFAVDFRVRRTF